jgi:non-lysosomal glucosylceramidase
MKHTDGIRSYDASASQTAFPLGGIGTGNVSLGARGDLRDWEIFNFPAKGNLLPNTFFAIRVQPQNGEAISRVLEGPLQAPHVLSHGYHPVSTTGLPRFTQSTLHGEYPFATVDLQDDSLPINVQLEAYTPLIPLNPEDSGIPCTILTYTVTNTSQEKLNLTLAGSIINPVGGLQFDKYGNIASSRVGKTVNESRDEDNLRGLYMSAEGVASDDLDYGSMALVTDHDQVTIKQEWMRGAWFDFLREFWTDFSEDGLLDESDYDEPPQDSKPDTGSLGIVDTLEAGESKSYRFILTWYFPNRTNNWNTEFQRHFRPGETPDLPSIIRNHYATRFDDAWQVAHYVKSEFLRLDKITRDFHDALFGCTFPPDVLDAISANIVPIRSNTCFWLEDGRFYGWEGCFDDEGCCPGSCTHVWSYAHTAAFLFPSLERVMREIEFEIETNDAGHMNFRTFKTFGDEFIWSWGEQEPEAAVDGQMGSILRTYREFLMCGDTDWLQKLWEPIKRSIGYADTHWDTDNDFVLDGRQHNTYDIEFYGPNPLSSIYYLAALRAVEEMAIVLHDPKIATNCRNAFEQGSKRLDELLWNGDYYIQQLDDIDAHPYQHGIGCLSDQLLGQLHARILGLGDLLPADHIRTAIGSVYKHNFRRNFKDHVNCQRTYILNDESGLLLCTWPDGGEPRFPFVYSDEVWTGIEYQVAAQLIYEDQLQEGLEIVTAARLRHDGERRNPWDEVECGHHYARTMSSWALLLALSGARTDLNLNQLHFNPKMDVSDDMTIFQTFWSTGKAWGTFRQEQDATGEWAYDVTVLGGEANQLQVIVNGNEVAVLA